MDARSQRRSKVLQERQIYRPGSGPLRKRDIVERRNNKDLINSSKVDNNEITCKSALFEDNANNMSKLRTKKPDVAIYVPKGKLKCDENEKKVNIINESTAVDVKAIKVPNNNDDMLDNCNIIKNVSSIKINDVPEIPPVICNNHDKNEQYNEIETFVVYNNATKEKHKKLPSIVLPENFLNLAPRFQKKFMLDHGLTMEEVKLLSEKSIGKHFNKRFNREGKGDTRNRHGTSRWNNVDNNNKRKLIIPNNDKPKSINYDYNNDTLIKIDNKCCKENSGPNIVTPSCENIVNDKISKQVVLEKSESQKVIDDHVEDKKSINTPKSFNWAEEVEEECNRQLAKKNETCNEEVNESKVEQLAWRKEQNEMKDLEKTCNETMKIEEKMNTLANIEILDKVKVPGLLKLPEKSTLDTPVYPMVKNAANSSQANKKVLFNPRNPNEPIIVEGNCGRMCTTQQPQVPVVALAPSNVVEIAAHYALPATEQVNHSRPAWYDAYSASFRSARNPHLLLDVNRADNELQCIMNMASIIQMWPRIAEIREFLKEALKTLLKSDLKFCESENVEGHIWKILYYTQVELLRKCVMEGNYSDQSALLLRHIIAEGEEYYKSILRLLQEKYEVDFDTAHSCNNKHGSLSNLALVSAQKVYLYLGDLDRYKQHLNNSSDFSIARKWYMTANKMNTRNGRPYNQLAILSLYDRKILDAIYNFVRSLMASNPFYTAREQLITLFDENRRKYEQIDEKRRQQKEKDMQEKAKEKESVINPLMMRREIWIRPDGRKRVHSSTTSIPMNETHQLKQYLNHLSSEQVYKEFIMTFIHVHGKLYTRIGMETLQEAGIQMLCQFECLLSRPDMPISANTMLKIIALNMFAIENTRIKEIDENSVKYRSAIQESALIISLEMFGILLQALHKLLLSSNNHNQYYHNAFIHVYLPSIKVWCDWLLCHGSLWNPPPSCQDYSISNEDCWSVLANLLNILCVEKDNDNELKSGVMIYDEPGNGNDNDRELIKLPEDELLSGFTPLMCNTQQPAYTTKNANIKNVYTSLRIRRIVFCGTVYLCGIDPAVIKLQKSPTGQSEYISLVETKKGNIVEDSCNNVDEDGWPNEEDTEDNNDDDCNNTVITINNNNNNNNNKDDEDDMSLRNRKEELQRKHEMQQMHRKRVQEIFNENVCSVEMEIRPHYLVPDTNCFIDSLDQLKLIAYSLCPNSHKHLYNLMVPLVVLNELEGLARGGRKNVSHRAEEALKFMRCKLLSTVKCVTTRGSVLTSATFTAEEDYTEMGDKNDDRILTTCMNLSKHHHIDHDQDTKTLTPGKPRKIVREVVLLTEDRNLRVKALSCDVPVQRVANFIKWAGLNNS